ncbi:MAG: capsid cement protein [Alphaproteobacteria bacterium]
MHNPLFEKAFGASGAIAKRRILALAATNGLVTQAVAASTALIGISDPGADVVSGKTVDVITHGIAELDYGDTIANGDPITADADGKGIAAAPATGVNMSIIGFAVEDGEDGVIGSVRLAPAIITGE